MALSSDFIAQLAVLTTQITAFREESRVGIESLRLLVTERQNHIEDKVDENRADIDDHEERIADLEKSEARKMGGAVVAGSVIGVIGWLLTIVADHADKLFKHLSA